MAEEKLRDAVQKVLDSSRQRVIHDAARAALKSGSNEDLTRALIVTRESANTWVAKKIANKALGFKE